MPQPSTCSLGDKNVSVSSKDEAEDLALVLSIKYLPGRYIYYATWHMLRYSNLAVVSGKSNLNVNKQGRISVSGV